MKKVKTLLVRFNNELAPHQISAFRGAVIEKVGREHTLFNHHVDDKVYLYDYPLIQYKSIGKKSAIMCIGDGVDDIYKLFHFKDWSININGTKVLLEINKLDLNNITLNVWDNSYDYLIRKWLPLNEKNFSAYQEITSLKQRCEFLEKIMIGNIISFAKGIEWTIEKKIVVTINEIIHTMPVKYKGIPLLSFDISFSCNVFLPSFLGLGKSVSHGFGTIIMNKKNN